MDWLSAEHSKSSRLSGWWIRYSGESQPDSAELTSLTRDCSEANEMVTIALWNPDENGKLRRTDRIPE
jgi:hypothetical protein